jgi:hypothetical protein
MDDQAFGNNALLASVEQNPFKVSAYPEIIGVTLLNLHLKVLILSVH